jgi:hypothetical protein
VNLSTSPAFTWLLAAAERITDHPVGPAQVLSGCAVVVGLVLIFLAAFSETRSVYAALFAEIAAAFSVNLWRWNGSLMEATFGFSVIALVLYLFRTDAPNAPGRPFICGVVLGVGVLLRPEIGLVVVLALSVQFIRYKETRVRDAALVILGVALVVTPCLIFALRHFGSVIPTTFAAKATGQFRLFNGAVLGEFMGTVFESILLPTLLIGFLFLAVRGKDVTCEKRKDLLSFVIPVGWIIGLVGFYYLKTPYLQSPGRYLLPLLPCEAMLLALLWSKKEDRLTLSQKRVAATVIALHVVFSITLNHKVVVPVLRRFDGEYAATMRTAAEELAKQTETSSNRRVLVEADIGVLSCAANGRFEIYDGCGLATPSLRGLDLRRQFIQVRPAYVIESLAEITWRNGV